MRLANGDGTVYKLSGKRRKPWCARITTGWSIKDGKAVQERKIIGTYATRLEALNSLAEYKSNPYDLNVAAITFKEVYDRWSEVHFRKISESNMKGVKASYRLCSKIENMKFQDIKLNHLQMVVDESGKNTPTLKKLKSMFSMMWTYAVINEIVTPDKKDIVKYLDISEAGNPNAYNRTRFSPAEIEKLWNNTSNVYVSIPLMLIYTGCRISELLELKKEDVHLDEKYFYVNKSKTEAGIREVPIADKVMKFFEYWMEQPSEYLLNTPEGENFDYRNYYDSYWKPIMEQLEIGHTPHCARYTCISRLTEEHCDERILKQIVGHKGQNVTEAVYTHIDLPFKLIEINKI